MTAAERRREGEVPARWWHRLADGRIECDLCPRHCRLREGQRGLCFVRARRGEAMVLTSWGRASGFCIDPIEKKPLFHLLPGSGVLSFGTAGCNLTCRFCQNWDISKARDFDRLQERASPAAIARAAAATGCRSVAYTYNDPVIFLEYVLDVAEACRAEGLLNVAVTAGYICAGPREELFARMDAANIDLKAFSEDFYRRVCGGHLQPVLETIAHVAQASDCWLELTTLLIPGYNDSDAEIARLAAWVRDHVGPDVPLHFTAFHPDWRLRHVPPTPPATLRRARAIARREGLRFVYVGNVDDEEGASTFCPGCGARVIGRRGYRLTAWALDANGRCRRCGTRLPGRFEPQPGDWGPRRALIQPAAFEPEAGAAFR